MSLAELIPPLWAPLLTEATAAPTFRSLEDFLDAERRSATVFPPESQVFSALALTPPTEVRAVIFGQDPYPTAGNANGLAFSVSPGVKVPASLRNLLAGLSLEFDLPKPTTGDLSPWARRGVLLLNTVLTVREGEANSHKKKGWEALTQAVISSVNAQPAPIVFFCFGKQAQALAAGIDSRHLVLCTPHPSPLNGHDFVKYVGAERPFTRANDFLSRAGRGAIDWSL